MAAVLRAARMSRAALFLEEDRTKQPYLQCRCTAFKILPLIYSDRRGRILHAQEDCTRSGGQDGI